MNAAVILVISILLLLAGYVFYGGWLAKEWGIDPKRKTPAHELEDGMDYVPAKAPVLMGHSDRRHLLRRRARFWRALRLNTPQRPVHRRSYFRFHGPHR